jgi:hypothetical protein
VTVTAELEQTPKRASLPPPKADSQSHWTESFRHVTMIGDAQDTTQVPGTQVAYGRHWSYTEVEQNVWQLDTTSMLHTRPNHAVPSHPQYVSVVHHVGHSIVP